jgi:hypothetical protein
MALWPRWRITITWKMSMRLGSHLTFPLEPSGRRRYSEHEAWMSFIFTSPTVQIVAVIANLFSMIVISLAHGAGTNERSWKCCSAPCQDSRLGTDGNSYFDRGESSNNPGKFQCSTPTSSLSVPATGLILPLSTHMPLIRCTALREQGSCSYDVCHLKLP